MELKWNLQFHFNSIFQFQFQLSYRTAETWRHYCPIGAQIQSDSKVAVACPSVPNNEAAHAQPLIEHWLTHWSSADNFIDQPTYRHNYVIFTFKNWQIPRLAIPIPIPELELLSIPIPVPELTPTLVQCGLVIVRIYTGFDKGLVLNRHWFIV